MSRASLLLTGAAGLAATLGLLLWRAEGAMIWLANGLPFCG